MGLFKTDGKHSFKSALLILILLCIVLTVLYSLPSSIKPYKHFFLTKLGLQSFDLHMPDNQPALRKQGLESVESHKPDNQFALRKGGLESVDSHKPDNQFALRKKGLESVDSHKPDNQFALRKEGLESVDSDKPDNQFAPRKESLKSVDSHKPDKHFYLRKKGLESVDLHEFKSKYINDLKDYELTTKPPGNRSLKIISCMDCPDWFRCQPCINSYNRDFKVCPYSECYFDHNGTMQSQATMVIYFQPILRSHQPPRPPGQIWVDYLVEAPGNKNLRSFRHYQEWKSAFNWTAGFSDNNELFWPSNRLGWRAKELLLTFDDYVQIAKRKTRSVAWFVSSCKVESLRDEYVNEMKKYVDVDIYGRCGNGTFRCKNWKKCLTLLNTTYRFYLAFENSFCEEYVTEKFFRSYRLRTFILPVARGGANYEHYFPASSFINTKNFTNAKELALYLKDLGNDHQKYASIMQEKDKLTTIEFRMDWCDICELLHTNQKQKIYPDIGAFILRKDQCWKQHDFL